MTRFRRTAPGTFLGQALGRGRAVLDVTGLLARTPDRATLRFVTRCLRVKPRYTMLSVERLRNLAELTRGLVARGVPGDIVECGAWRGGAAAFMADAARTGGEVRGVWLFDSFAGLPPPGPRDDPQVRAGYFPGWDRADVADVERVFRMFRYPRDRVHIVPGWFRETMRTPEVRSIAILHVDADWYESVNIALDRLADRVVSGGVIVVDDYGRWGGCRSAVDEFLAARGIPRTALIPVGRAVRLFKASFASRGSTGAPMRASSLRSANTQAS